MTDENEETTQKEGGPIEQRQAILEGSRTFALEEKYDGQEAHKSLLDYKLLAQGKKKTEKTERNKGQFSPVFSQEL